MTKEEIQLLLTDLCNIKESLNGLRELLKEYELTGMERLEKLQPSLPSDLDEAAEEALDEDFGANWYIDERDDGCAEPGYNQKQMLLMFKAGAEWMAGQGETVEGVFKAGDPGYPDVRMGEQYSIEHILRKPDGIEPGDEVIVRIRKKQ